MAVLLLLATGGVLARDAEADLRPVCSPPVETDEKEAEFDCGAQAEFPMEEYEKALSDDETTKELVASYDKQVDEKALVCPSKERQISAEEMAADQALVARTSWLDLCPKWSYTIWRWGIDIPPYGRCYVLTPIRVTRCSRPNRPCRYIYPFFWSRCRQVYRRVYFLAYCPNAPHRFVWRARLFPRDCNCQRLVCGFLRS